MKIGNSIKKIRLELKYSQKSFAELCEISQTYLSQIETNKKVPNFKILELISQKADVPLPVILFLSIDDSEVREDRMEIYKMFKPTIDKFISDIFLEKNDFKT